MSSILSKPSHTYQTSFSPPFLSLYYHPCPSPSPDLLSVSIPNTILRSWFMPRVSWVFWKLLWWIWKTHVNDTLTKLGILKSWCTYITGPWRWIFIGPKLGNGCQGTQGPRKWMLVGPISNLGPMSKCPTLHGHPSWPIFKAHKLKKLIIERLLNNSSSLFFLSSLKFFRP